MATPFRMSMPGRGPQTVLTICSMMLMSNSVFLVASGVSIFREEKTPNGCRKFFLVRPARLERATLSSAS